MLDGRYLLTREIAAGAMGRVFEAEHVVLGRRVAIKLASSRPSPRVCQRMLQEARVVQRLTGEHVVRIFDVGFLGGLPYIVMELLEGSDLARLVASRGPLPVPEAVGYVLQAAAGIAEAHAAGVIHRDVKPANLFLTRGGVVKLIDFGISKLAEPLPSVSLTEERALLGSPRYMSPEQLRNPVRVDERSDVWSLGVTLFHLLSGAHPFEGDTLNEVSASIFVDRPRDLGELRADVPARLRRAIAATLAKRPEDRTPSVAAFAASLQGFERKLMPPRD